MIRGHFSDRLNSPPYVVGFIDIPAVGVIGMRVEFLIDTGADTSLIGNSDANRMSERFDADLTNLREGQPSYGLGGVSEMKTAEATLIFDDFSKNLRIDILEPSPDIQFRVPSLLGRDILSHFALFVEERTRKVLLLEPDEADALGLE